MSDGKHLLLDFGGVCLLTPFELNEPFENKHDLEAGTLSWRGPHDPSSDPLWQLLLEGEVSEREYWHQRAADTGRAVGRVWSLKQYFGDLYDFPEDVLVRPGAFALVEAVKATGRKASVLTNDLAAFHGPAWVDQITFFRAIDSLTDASKTGILKPDPRAYQQAAEDMGVPLSEILFVDDQPGNIRGAEEVGLESVYFDVTDPERSWAEARARLGLG